MRLQLRILTRRIRAYATVSLLRLTGLALAALLAAAVPAFVTTAMEQVLVQQLKTIPDATSVHVAWHSADEDDHGQDLARLDSYLRTGLPAAAGIDPAAVTLAQLSATPQRPVQKMLPGGGLEAAKRYLKLAPLPAGGNATGSGLELGGGRFPEPGKPEVALPESTATRLGLQAGDQLRFPLTADGRGQAVTLTVSGLIRTPAAAPWSQLAGTLETTLLTSPDLLSTLSLPTGEAAWSLVLAPDKLHAAGVAGLVGTLEQLPGRAAQLLPETDVVSTPLAWLTDFLLQMDSTRSFLLVLLTPVFLLVTGFALATAGAVVASRRTEMAVLRSRGAAPLRIVGFYLPESLALAAVGAVTGLLLAPPTVRLMGLTAGFMQLVGRPPLPVRITGETVLYAVLAALLVEAVALIPVVRATRFTVATIRDESATRSPLAAAARVTLELALLAVLAYGTWRLRAGGSPAGDALFLALPTLALAAAGAVALRLVEAAVALFDRLFRRRLSPPLYLASSLIARESGRHRSLWLMLVVTAGLGIYGAAFARTLDRDLVASSRYRLGADLVLHTAWESEVLSYNADGEPQEVAYHEPPFDPILGLPGATAAAKVQTRRNLSLTLGSRNLGKAAVMGVTPQEFGQTARFLQELTPDPPGRYLDLLARDEQAVLVSAPLAERLGLKAGDRITVKESNGAKADLVVAAAVPYWPGRLPEDGDFLVGSLSYLQDSLGLAPYDVWLRLTPDTSATALAQLLADRGVKLTGLEDSRAAVAAGRRQPFRLGIYGTLSAGFVVALAVMALTYLLGVGLTLQGRARELGVLRAMGMARAQVGLALYLEQAVLILAALAAGLPAGAAAASAYVPLLRLQAGQVPLPLKVTTVQADGLVVLLGSALALAAGMTAVRTWLRRLNIGKALRLGEDA